MRSLFVFRGLLYTLLIVLAFYVPATFLIPDEQGWARWGVWTLGWTAAFAVEWFTNWYRSTYAN